MPYGSYSELGLYGALVPYGSLNLTDSSPAQNFVEPLDLDAVKSFLKIPVRSPADSAEDTQLQMLITAAREQAEILQRRDLVRKQWDLSHDYWPSYHIELRAPLVSVDLVQYKDATGLVTTMTEDTDYVVDTAKAPGAICPPYNKPWPMFTPWPTSAILIRLTSGFSATDSFWSNSGARVKNGMLLLISAWYYQRLPFEIGMGATQEYPYAVTSCLSYGAVPSVR